MRDETGEDLDLRDSPTGVVGRFLESGEVRKRPVKDKRRNLYRALPDQVTLADLMRHAESCVDPDKEGTAGRDPIGGLRTVKTISPRQFERMKTAANSLAKHLTTAAERKGLRGYNLWSTVTDGSLWTWDSASLPTRSRGWQRMYDVIRDSAPRNRRSADRGAMLLLLDLCGSDHLLSRQDRGDRWLIPDAWSATQERWVESVKDVRWRHFALNEILRIIAELYGPEYDLERLANNEVEATRVLDRIRDHLLATAGTMTSTQRTYLRKALKALMEAGLFLKLTIDRYDLRKHDRFKAWSQGYDRAIAKAHATGTDGDIERAWLEFPFPGLADADNPFSLRAAVSWWVDSPHRPAEEAMPGVFPRKAPRKTKSRGRGDDDTGTLWSEPTAKGNLTILAYLVGVLQAYAEDIDLQTADLRDLLTLEHAELVLKAHKDGRIPSRMAGDILIYMGLLASPYMERMALREEAMDLADRMFDLAARVTGYGAPVRKGAAIEFVGRSLKKKLKAVARLRDPERDDEGDSEERQRSNALLQQRIFKKVMGVDYAFDGLELIYRAALNAVLSGLEATSVRDLHERWGAIQPNRVDLVALRALAMWNDCLSAPMRARAIAGQTMGMREETRGSLHLDVRSHLMKVPHSNYQVVLHEAGSSGYDLDMWHLYRDLVRPALLDGKGNGIGPVFVNDQRSANTKYIGISEPTVNCDIRRVFDLAGAPLGYGDNTAFRGCRSSHYFRHAVGSKYVNMGEVHIAKDLLHHTRTDTTEKIYSHKGLQISTGAERAAVESPAEAGPPVQDLLARIEQRPELLAEIEKLLAGEEDAT